MKAIKALLAVILTEIIIAIPVVTGVYVWGMVGFQPESTNGNECAVVGKFYGDLELTDSRGKQDTYYQFRSADNEVWWLLTATEIGCVPDTSAHYILRYNNNGTTRENKPCDCLPEWDCECEVYDDEFISIKELQTIAER